MAAHLCSEACDDGNTLGGDGCSAACQAEGVTDQASFSGTGQGGSIAITVNGVPLTVTTYAGDSAAMVTSRVSAAINANGTPRTGCHGDPGRRAPGGSRAIDLSPATTRIQASHGAGTCRRFPASGPLLSPSFSSSQLHRRIRRKVRDFRDQAGFRDGRAPGVDPAPGC
jgi:cysteine-rich repeat protein